MLRGVISRQVDAVFEPMSASIEPVRTGQLRALAVRRAGRSQILPNVPRVGEPLAGYEASAVPGIGAPAGTPPEIIDPLTRAINAAFTDPAMKARLVDTGGAPL